MSAQRRWPLLAEAPRPVAPEPLVEPDFAPVTPETQAHMRMLQCFDVRLAASAEGRSTYRGDPRPVIAERLRAFATRSYPPAMVLAGSLLVRHGDMARVRNLDGRLLAEVSDTERRVDSLLAEAGVPAAVQMEAL